MQDVVIVLLIALLVLRIPAAIQRPLARPTWFATFFAVIGLLTLDLIVPLTFVDQLLGGTNLWNLVEALASVAGIWFFSHAVKVIQGISVSVRGMWVFAGMLAAMTVAFFLIPNRGNTDLQFVADHLRYSATWVYLLIFMVSFGAIAARSAWLLRRRWKGKLVIFLVGYALLVIACLLDVAYITTAHFNLGSTEFSYSFYMEFNLFFYAGIFCVAVGFVVFWVTRMIHKLAPFWRVCVFRLERIQRHRAAKDGSFWSAIRAATGEQPIVRANAQLIRIRDLELTGHAPLTQRDKEVLARVESRLNHRAALRTLSNLTN